MLGEALKYCSALLFCILVTGCADSPFAELAHLNPYNRQQWQEDERRGPTFHTQLAEIRGLRNNPEALSPQEQERTIQQLSEIARDSTISVLREEATLTLAAFQSPSAIPALRAALSDESVDVRIAACRALGRQGGDEALAALGQVLQTESDGDVRLAATGELAKFQGPAAVEALTVALNDGNPALQHRAVQSLKSATGEDFGDSVPAWRDYVDGRIPEQTDPPTIAERLRRWSWH